MIVPCIPAPVSCLDRAQTCHLRRWGRARSLPFSCFCQKICSSVENAGLGQLCSLQAASCTELLEGRGFLQRECRMQLSPSPLSGKTRHLGPRPSALDSFVAIMLGLSLSPSLDSCKLSTSLSLPHLQRENHQTLFTELLREETKKWERKWELFILCSCVTNYRKS